MSAEGRKDDQGKLDLTKLLALPEDMLRALCEVAEVEEYGAKKYEKGNWRKVDRKRYLAATVRHVIDEIVTPGARDQESRRLAIAHAICDLLFVHCHNAADGSSADIPDRGWFIWSDRPNGGGIWGWHINGERFDASKAKSWAKDVHGYDFPMTERAAKELAKQFGGFEARRVE